MDNHCIMGHIRLNHNNEAFPRVDFNYVVDSIQVLDFMLEWPRF